MNRRRPAKRDRSGMKQLACWLPADVVDRLTAHVRAQPGAQLRLEVTAALEQYLARPALAAAE